MINRWRLTQGCSCAQRRQSFQRRAPLAQPAVVQAHQRPMRRWPAHARRTCRRAWPRPGLRRVRARASTSRCAHLPPAAHQAAGPGRRPASRPPCARAPGRRCQAGGRASGQIRAGASTAGWPASGGPACGRRPRAGHSGRPPPAPAQSRHRPAAWSPFRGGARRPTAAARTAAPRRVQEFPGCERSSSGACRSVQDRRGDKPAGAGSTMRLMSAPAQPLRGGELAGGEPGRDS